MINEIRRLKDLGLSQVKISLALGISRNTVQKYLDAIVKETGNNRPNYSASWSTKIDWQQVHAATNQGLALAHFHEEQVQPLHPEISYMSFWREYKRRYPQVPIHYHKTHNPGLRCEVDYKGDAYGLGYIDPITREFIACRLFGSILCFSQLFYARATHSVKQIDWLESIAEGYNYFGGVPLTTASDNDKSLVTKAHRYDPDLNPEFGYFAEHFSTAPLAMRPYQPKDKNLIECTLGVFWRWIRMRMRGQTFWSLGELNRFLHLQLDIFNERVQKKYGVSRRQKFIAGERDHLLALPAVPYSSGEWRQFKVHPDGRIQVQHNFYTVPWQHIGKEVAARISSGFIEVFSGLDRIALHSRVSPAIRGRYITQEVHLPPLHHEMNKSTPEYLVSQAEEIGPATVTIVRRLFTEASHPLMYLRRVQGILRLAKRHSKEQLEKSSAFLKDRNFSELRLNNFEAIIKCPPEQNLHKKVIRNQNNHLRGQSHWSTPNLSESKRRSDGTRKFSQ